MINLLTDVPNLTNSHAQNSRKSQRTARYAHVSTGGRMEKPNNNESQLLFYWLSPLIHRQRSTSYDWYW